VTAIETKPDTTPDRDRTGGISFASTAPVTFNSDEEFSITNGNAAGGTTHTMTFVPRGSANGGKSFTDIIQPGQKFKYSARGIASVAIDSGDSNVVGQRGIAGTIFGGQTGPSSAAGSGLASSVFGSLAPADALITASETFVQAGFAASGTSGVTGPSVITPLKTGLILAIFNIDGAAGEGGDADVGVKFEITWGTGSPPASLSAVAGTAVGVQLALSVEGNAAAPLITNGLVVALINAAADIGSAVWVDVAMVSGGVRAGINGANWVLMELGQ